MKLQFDSLRMYILNEILAVNHGQVFKQITLDLFRFFCDECKLGILLEIKVNYIFYRKIMKWVFPAHRRCKISFINRHYLSVPSKADSKQRNTDRT